MYSNDGSYWVQPRGILVLTPAVSLGRARQKWPPSHCARHNSRAIELEGRIRRMLWTLHETVVMSQVLCVQPRHEL